MREDRLFLLLSVVIGIFSGLAVVCFRLAIEWTQITLLGSHVSLILSNVRAVGANVRPVLSHVALVGTDIRPILCDV